MRQCVYSCIFLCSVYCEYTVTRLNRTPSRTIACFSMCYVSSQQASKHSNFTTLDSCTQIHKTLEVCLQKRALSLYHSHAHTINIDLAFVCAFGMCVRVCVCVLPNIANRSVQHCFFTTFSFSLLLCSACIIVMLNI